LNGQHLMQYTMTTPLVFTARRWRNAIILIAACAMLHWAGAQNVPENPATARQATTQATTQAIEANERAERERINQQSASVSADYEAARAQCYQRFLVNACLAEARDNHNNQQADLKRQANALNDIQRKRRGAEQLERTEEKQSSQRQEEIATQRSKALAGGEKRDQRQSERATAAAQNATAAKPGAAKDKSARTAPQARPSNQVNQVNQASQQARANEKAANLKRKKANAAQAKAEQEQRVKEAAEHRESVKNRQQKRKKPPAASLPLPPG
jgi:colicin import membrane protein